MVHPSLGVAPKVESDLSGISGVARRKHVVLVAAAFFITSEPTALTTNHGILPIGVLLVIAVVTLLRDKSSAMAWWALAPFTFVGIAAASSGWSILPDETITGTISLASVFALSVLFAAKVKLPALVEGIALGAGAALAASIILSVLRPDLGLVNETYKYGSLRGIYEHRNQMGYVMTVGLVALCSTPRLMLKGRRGYGIMALLLFALGVAWSASSTALAMSVIGVALAVGFRIMPKVNARLRPFIITYYLLITAFAFWFIPTQFATVTGLLGRDETLTGRTTIWPYVVEAWSHSPWLGYGWDAVWLDGSYVADWVARQFNYRIYHSHDSYLDVLIQVGILGLASFGVCVFISLLKGLAWLRLLLTTRATISAVFPLVIVTVLGIYSIVETRISKPLGLLIIFYVVTTKIAPMMRKSETSTPPPGG
ncbi:O-antigen ligase family protein [Pseudarthrobacter niigatensis]|uniref:O-antigen ligase n=1 Tax=Pseudarthrobacter niigatensis TaxID=369935 RepID=A0AAJ1SY92_9MICC|nr:O-antigen ligase family protein [Pseudarthrobacter niigatensis]MDQ0145997.1 O-antigen ligase [Pseudarthrobacter niigatensis]MDQ0266275.1 O-antigen ligase [Pseudarthrobacter niigatensis]